MTTFKEGPLYAEALFRLLDNARLLEDFYEETTILEAYVWKFKGGDMTETVGAYPLEHSGSYFVDCYSHELAAIISHDPSVQHLPNRFKDLASYREIIANRKSRTRKAELKSTMAICVASLHVSGSPVEPRSVFSGLKGVYKVLERLMQSEKSLDTSALTDVYAYMSEMLAASATSGGMDYVSVRKNFESVKTALGKVPVAAIWSARANLSKIIGDAEGKVGRKYASRIGLAALAGSAKDRADLNEDMWSMGSYMRWAGLKYRVLHRAIVFKMGSRYVVMAPSDYKRLYNCTTSIVSCLVGAAAQSATGPLTERHHAARLPMAMYETMVEMVSYGAAQRVGDEVLACKAYKKAFTVYLGTISGPLCAEETRVLREEAIEGMMGDEKRLDRFLARVSDFPAGMAMDVGKSYKILAAPDSSPGATVIARLATTVTPNAVDPAMLAMLREMLEDQVAYSRALSPAAGRLLTKVGVPIPVWYRAYAGGDMTVVPMDGLRNVLAWEKSADLVKRQAIDPSVWKDSGLAADTVAEGLGDKMPLYKRNMLMRMIFDPHCPMPGDEENVYPEEVVAKSDGKPESHKDPNRSIFSSNLQTRFAKSVMEASVGEVACNNPSNMIGASPEKRAVRIRAATTHMATAAADVTPFFYSFDVKGWSPLMAASVQEMSHEVWGRLFRTDLFNRSSQFIQGARVYVNNGGYKGWYVNTESNFEGFDGKEVTALNSSMLALSVKRWRADPAVVAITTQAERNSFSALLLAYIDDGMARVEIPRGAARAMELFGHFKRVCRETFAGCGFTIEVSKCFPSDVFFIFLNEAYLAGRHLVHGIRAASQICSALEEDHDTLLSMVDKVTGGVRGAVVAGLDPYAGVTLMALHLYDTISRWVGPFDPVTMAVWTMGARAWGCMGVPNATQLDVSASGNAHPEAVATMQAWARINPAVRRFYLNCMRTPVKVRSKVAILLAPMSIRLQEGYMTEGKVPKAISNKLGELSSMGKLGVLPEEFYRFSDFAAFEEYAEITVPGEPGDAVQAQMLADQLKAAPYSIYMSFCRRIEKGATVRGIIGRRYMEVIRRKHREEAVASKACVMRRMEGIVL